MIVSGQEQVLADHRTTLDDLVAEGDLTVEVADQLHNAYAAAVSYVCATDLQQSQDSVGDEVEAVTYSPLATPSVLTDTVKEDLRKHTGDSAVRLVQQADLLLEMAESGTLDSEAIALVQSAIEREMVLLDLTEAEQKALSDALLEAAGEGYEFPDLAELEIEVSPEAAEAARYLVQLLVEGP